MNIEQSISIYRYRFKPQIWVKISKSASDKVCALGQRSHSGGQIPVDVDAMFWYMHCTTWWPNTKFVPNSHSSTWYSITLMRCQNLVQTLQAKLNRSVAFFSCKLRTAERCMAADYPQMKINQAHRIQMHPAQKIPQIWRVLAVSKISPHLSQKETTWHCQKRKRGCALWVWRCDAHTRRMSCTLLKFKFACCNPQMHCFNQSTTEYAPLRLTDWNRRKDSVSLNDQIQGLIQGRARSRSAELLLQVLWPRSWSMSYKF